MKTRRHLQQRGLGAIAIIVIIVVLGALAASIARLGTASHRALSNDVTAARALQAAHAGKEWGLYQALHAGASWNSCSGNSQTLDLTADFGMHVNVSCNSILYNEGLQDDGVTPKTVRIFTIDALACSSTSCPDNSRSVLIGYVERRVVAQASN